jgi:iron complex outermembrane receptor protein
MNRIAIVATVSAAALAAASPAFAQDEGRATQEIIVTANRVQSLASKTPIALTAVSGEQLSEGAITNPTQLADAAPNLSIVRANGLQITIRGVTSTDQTEKGDPSAAFLLNGIYVARPQFQEVSFFDVQRVEVLRGPQGTLYGRNTTAGLINVISKEPDFKPGAQADVSYESYNHMNATAAVNVPEASTLALRAAVNFDRQDSYATNGSGDGVSYNPFKNNRAARLSALWRPSDSISLKIVGDISRLEGTGFNTVDATNFFAPTAPLSNPAATSAVRPIYRGGSADALRTNHGRQAWTPSLDNKSDGVLGELNIGLGSGVTLTYLGSYRESERHERSTLSGTSRQTFDGDYKQTSHELRLAYAEGPLQAQVGGYYFRERSSTGLFILNPTFLPFPAERFGFPQDPTIAVNKSVFGQGTLEVLDGLRLTAGVRYSADDKSRVGSTVLDTPSFGGFPGQRLVIAVNDAKRSFSRTTWRAGVDYDSPLGLVYASVATGYKAGGFNDGCAAGAGASPTCTLAANELYYEPETLTAYEAGAKLRFAGNAVRVNASVFHYDYKGLQLSKFGNFGGCGLCSLTTNAAGAKVDGLEVEAFLQPVPALQVRLGLDLLDARYAEFSPTSSAGVTVNFKGHDLARSPSVVTTAGAVYTHALANGGSLVAGANVRLSSRYLLTDLTNLIDAYQPSYTKTDLSLNYNAPDQRFYIGVYVENLENNIVLTGADFGFANLATFADPRRAGVRAGFKF